MASNSDESPNNWELRRRAGSTNNAGNADDNDEEENRCRAPDVDSSVEDEIVEVTWNLNEGFDHSNSILVQAPLAMPEPGKMFSGLRLLSDWQVKGVDAPGLGAAGQNEDLIHFSFCRQNLLGAFVRLISLPCHFSRIKKDGHAGGSWSPRICTEDGRRFYTPDRLPSIFRMLVGGQPGSLRSFFERIVQILNSKHGHSSKHAMLSFSFIEWGICKLCISRDSGYGATDFEGYCAVVQLAYLLLFELNYFDSISTHYLQWVLQGLQLPFLLDDAVGGQPVHPSLEKVLTFAGYRELYTEVSADPMLLNAFDGLRFGCLQIGDDINLAGIKEARHMITYLLGNNLDHVSPVSSNRSFQDIREKIIHKIRENDSEENGLSILFPNCVHPFEMYMNSYLTFSTDEPGESADDLILYEKMKNLTYKKYESTELKIPAVITGPQIAKEMGLKFRANTRSACPANNGGEQMEVDDIIPDFDDQYHQHLPVPAQSVPRAQYDALSTAYERSQIDLDELRSKNAAIPTPTTTTISTIPLSPNSSSTTTIKFYKPSQYFLEKCCKKLGMDYTDQVYKFWFNISIHQVSPSSIPDKLYTTVESKYHGFECLSLYLTGAEDKAADIREKVNEYLFQQNSRSSAAINRQIEGVALFSPSITDHHLTLIAGWLNCRIGIFVESSWKRYGNWDATDADIPILLMELKNGKYSPILTLK